MTNLVDAGTVTLGGSYSYANGRVTLQNTNFDFNANTAYIRLNSLSSIRTIQLWFKQEGNQTVRYFLDGRYTWSNSYWYSGGYGDAFASASFRIGAGSSESFATSYALSKFESVGEWKFVTVELPSSVSAELTLFARTSGSEGMYVTFGTCLVYNRALSDAEVIQNYEAVTGLAATMSPSMDPTSWPSSAPTNPTSVPSVRPSGEPSGVPTGIPSSAPTNPTSVPSSTPTNPSSLPTAVPSGNPSSEPSAVPSSTPTNPTSTPSSKPSAGASVVSSGLVAYVDTSKPSSFSGSGSTMTNLVDAGSVTLGGSYSYANGRVTLQNTNFDFNANTAYIRLNSLSSIRTIQLWFKQEGNQTVRYFLDGRYTWSNSYWYSGGYGDAFASASFRIGAGSSESFATSYALSKFESVGEWKFVTVELPSSVSAELTLFARTSGSEGMYVTFGTCLVYNRALSDAEVIQNYEAVTGLAATM
eukprot:gene12852-9189_t